MKAIELLRQGRTPGELAESLGVSPQTLRNWRRQVESSSSDGSDAALCGIRKRPWPAPRPWVVSAGDGP